jgi:hypothetical protein
VKVAEDPLKAGQVTTLHNRQQIVNGRVQG